MTVTHIGVNIFSGFFPPPQPPLMPGPYTGPYQDRGVHFYNQHPQDAYRGDYVGDRSREYFRGRGRGQGLQRGGLVANIRVQVPDHHGYPAPRDQGRNNKTILS